MFCVVLSLPRCPPSSSPCNSLIIFSLKEILGMHSWFLCTLFMWYLWINPYLSPYDITLLHIHSIMWQIRQASSKTKSMWYWMSLIDGKSLGKWAVISLNSSNRGYNFARLLTSGVTSFITMASLCLIPLDFIKNSPRLQIDKKDRPSTLEAKV